MKISVLTSVVLAILLSIASGCSSEEPGMPEVPKTDVPVPDKPGSGPNEVIRFTPRVDIVLTEKESSFVNGQIKNALNLFSKLNEANTASENLFFSPFSANIDLAMLANGAGGETQKDMLKVLMSTEGSTLQELNSFNNKLVTDLGKVDGTVSFNSNNSIWLHNGLFKNILAPFIEVNKESYNAGVYSVDMLSKKASESINTWVNENTKGLIPLLYRENELPGCDIALINALYFRALWKYEFNETTVKEKFNNYNSTTSTVEMMTGGGVFISTRIDETLVFPMDFGNSGYRMVFFVPDPGKSMKDFITKLDYEKWSAARKSMKPEYDIYNIKMPVFEIDSKLELNDILKQIGLGSMFGGKADFSNISDIKFGNLEIKQLSKLRVGVTGVEAASLTLEQFGSAPLLPEPTVLNIVLDRPFSFLIEEASSGTILFMGTVNKL